MTEKRAGVTTILGAGGPIGNELAAILAAKGERFRLVSRTGHAAAIGETVKADLSDMQQTVDAVAGSSVVHLVAGLKYDAKVWAELWPRIMANTIEACKRADARLVFFDNVYMYGAVNGPMTEETPYAPCSKKGETRARIAESLMNEVKTGGLTAMIARAADFYGPQTKHGLPNVLVFEPYAKGGTASWIANADVPHSLTYTPDAARGVAMLAEDEGVWNQVWHLPTATPALSGRRFIELAAAEMGVKPKFRVLGRAMLGVVGLFQGEVREIGEMLYQNDRPYLFDSSKFARRFGFAGTPYAEGIRAVARSYREGR